jgi:hypothetical protein
MLSQKSKFRLKLFSIISVLTVVTVALVVFGFATNNPSPTLTRQAADIYIGLNEGYGSSANDTNSTVSVGTITNAVWKAEDLCRTGKCLYFDGTGDYVSYSDNANLDMAATDNVTVEGWFRTSDISSGYRTLVQKYNMDTGSDGGYEVVMNGSGQILFQFDSDDTSFPLYSLASTASYDDNKWHHFAAVKNGASSASLYVDTISVSTTSISSTDASNSDSFTIGADWVGADSWLGFIDEVKVLRTARTATEIKADYVGETPSRGTSASFGPDQSYLSEGLVGYWKMDETDWGTPNCSTDVVFDYSGNGVNGDACPNSTGPTGGETGKFGNGVTFETTDDYINLDSSSSLKPTTKISVSAWVNTPLTSTFNTVIGGRTNFAANYWFVVKNTGRVAVNLENIVAHGTFQTDVDTISADTWTNIAFTYDSTAGNNNANIYINGQVKKSLTLTGLIGYSDTNMSLGFTEYGFGGTMDEVRVYNRALSPAEVQDLYEWAPGPVAYYKFDEGTGTTSVNDSSGNGNTGTMNGSMTESDWVSGKYGSALDFDSTDDRINAGSASYVDDIFDGGGTVEAWVNLRSDGESDKSNIISKDTVAFHVSADGSGLDIGLDQGFSGGGANWFVWNTFSINTWAHVSVTYDNSSASNDPTFYVNGIKQTLNTDVNSTGTRTSDAASSLYFGGDNLGGATIDGKIDDIRIYDYVRTPAQIIEDMNAGHPAPGSPVGSAVSHWKFDEGYGTTANDSGYGDNDLTLQSSPTYSASGKFANALSFTRASSQYASISDSADLSITGDLTLSAWIKPSSNSASTEYGIAGKWESTNQSYLLSQYGDEIRMYIDSSSNYVTTTAANLATGTWYHVMGIYNASAQTAKIYINGVIQPVSITGTIPGSIGDDASAFRVGVGNDNSTIISKTISANGYDCFEDGNGNLLLSGYLNSQIWMGYWSPGSEYGGYIFTGITIPQSTVITSAKLTLKAIGGATLPVNLKVVAEDANSPGVWATTTHEPSIITETTAKVDWDISTWSSGTSYDSPSLTSIVQELVDSNDYSSENMAFVVRNDGMSSNYDIGIVDYNDASSDTAALEIKYGDNGYFNGLIDEVKVYNSALTADQVKTDYNGGFVEVLGNTGTTSTGAASNASIDLYCPPGQGSSCSPPLRHFKLDENTGTSTVNDSMGTGTCSMNGSMTSTDWVPGKYSSGLDFDGDNDYLNCGSNSDIDNLSALTVTAWIRPRTLVTDDVIVEKDDSGTTAGGWSLIGYSNYDLYFFADFDGATNLNVTTNSDAIPLNTWSFVTVTWDGSGTGSNVKFYVNGIQRTTSVTTNGAGSRVSDVANNLNIGSDDGSYEFDGIIDDVHVYNYVRTPAQIAWEYNRGAPVGWWELDENQTGDGQTVYDASGNGNNGTTEGGTGNLDCTVTGKRNTACDFDGGDDYINITYPSSGTLDFSNDFSVSAWVYRDTADTHHTIVAKKAHPSTGDGYILSLYDDNTVYFQTSDGSNSCSDTTYSTLSSSSWHHIVGVYTANDGSPSNIKIYVDGKLSSNSPNGCYMTPSDIPNTNNVRIGAETDAGNPFDGKIDEVKIFNYALTEQQIKNDYSQGAVNFSN